METFGALARRARARYARRATLLALAVACSEPRTAAVATPEPATRPEAAAQRPPAVQYRVAPPAGKLPWPQHDPAFSPEQYEAMLRDLYIANNFALLQSGPEPSTSYLHHGIDVVLDNGTPIHAVQAGHVRYIMDAPQAEFYKWIVIEDADAPGEGWGYAHVDDFRVKVGDYVPQGTRIASVRFRGLEHVHMDRIRRPDGGSWSNLYTLVNAQPESYFVYDDTQPPVFFDRMFYFRNQSDSAFARPAGGARVTVSGDVDVVVGVRDPGEHGHSRRFPLDDRQAPARLEYAIAPLGQTAPRRPSFDFRTLQIPRLRSEAPVAFTVFKFYRTVIPTNAPSAFESRMAFYVVTNVPEGGRAGMIDTADAALSWRTAERRADGAPRYPDGEYVVTVWAYDFKGNVASRSDTVRVRN